MPVIKHVHTYVRYKGRPGYFMCAAPDCTHFMDKARIEGKLSLCTECGNQMILTREDLKRVRPKCLNCSDTKKARLHRKAQELTKYLGTEAFNPLGLIRSKDQESLFPSLTEPEEDPESEPEEDEKEEEEKYGAERG